MEQRWVAHECPWAPCSKIWKQHNSSYFSEDSSG